MKILVLDAHAPAALAVVRSLGRAGVAVDVAGEEGAFNLCFFSRFPGKKILYPSPAEGVRRFLAFLTALAPSYRLIIPVTDRTIVPLQRLRSSWDGRCVIALPGAEALEKTLDKRRTMELARECAVRSPSTDFSEGKEGIASLAARLRYPAVVKSRFSKHVCGDRLVSAPEPVFCGSGEELRAAAGLFTAGCLIQEMVKGEGYGISVLARDGVPLAVFAHHRLREENPLGARSSFCESIRPPPPMKDHALRLIKALQWTGPAMVEFKWEGEGEPVLMEINGRYWGSLPLALAAGVNFPLLHYRLLTGESAPPDAGYRVGVRARYLCADLQRLIEVWKGPPQPWIKSYPQRGEAVRDFLRGFSPRIKSFNSDRDDPLPGWAEVVRFAARLGH